MIQRHQGIKQNIFRRQCSGCGIPLSGAARRYHYCPTCWHYGKAWQYIQIAKAHLREAQ